MPKTKTADEISIIPDATNIVDLAETNESKEVVIEPVKVEVPTGKQDIDIVLTRAVTKNVRIKTFEKVDCIVGKIPYKIDKDREAFVPSDVAAILVTSKKAFRL